MAPYRPTIGLLTHGAGDPNSCALWAGAAEAARRHDASLVCFPGKPIRSPIAFEAQSNILYELVGPDRIDGLVAWLANLTILASPGEVRAMLERYRGVRIVTCGGFLAGYPQFREFGMPLLDFEVRHFTHNFSHIDGTGVLRHLDAILELPNVQAIQWVQGLGPDAPMLQWAPLLRSCRTPASRSNWTSSPKSWTNTSMPSRTRKGSFCASPRRTQNTSWRT